MYEEIEKLLKEQYGVMAQEIEKSKLGAGSDTYFVTCNEGKLVVKFPSESDMNKPELEPEVCEYLIQHGIRVCDFLPNKQGKLLSYDETGRCFHVQHFVSGITYAVNTAPPWLMKEAAATLGKIHRVLKEYHKLPTGIGADFFRYMTPQNAMNAYEHSLDIAKKKYDIEIEQDLRYRLGLMSRFPNMEFDLSKLTLCSTHGDYMISQWICDNEILSAVIDWTTACVHPVVWEIIRSYVYASPYSVNGEINCSDFLAYVREYQKEAKLSTYDLQQMGRLFYYQIAVCDYYGQYYHSTQANRHIYLDQAVFSTKLLHWFDQHLEELETALATA